jgi:hypothetical protein
MSHPQVISDIAGLKVGIACRPPSEGAVTNAEMRSGELSTNQCGYLMKGGLLMPVRKIPRFGAQKNIGKFSSVKTGRVAWFESLLERDYMYLLDYELAIVGAHEEV